MECKVYVHNAIFTGKGCKLLLIDDPEVTLYGPELAKFDTMSGAIYGDDGLVNLPYSYINNYVRCILGSSIKIEYGSNVFINEVLSKIKVYNLDSYPVDEPFTVKVDENWNIVTDTELVDTKNEVIDIVNSSTSMDELKSEMMDLFNLVEPTQVNVEKVTPSNIMPRNLDGLVNIINPQLNTANVIGNYVKVEVLNPITDFMNGNELTELGTKLTEFYSDWVISMESEVENQVKYTEVLPISDPNMYLKVGQLYVTALPDDIEIGTGGSYYKLFSEGPTVPRVVFSPDENTQYDLTLDSLKLINSEGEVTSLSEVSYRSSSTGTIGSDIYIKLNSGEFQSVPGLSSNLAMYSKSITPVSKTIMKFYFK